MSTWPNVACPLREADDAQLQIDPVEHEDVAELNAVIDGRLGHDDPVEVADPLAGGGGWGEERVGLDPEEGQVDLQPVLAGRVDDGGAEQGGILDAADRGPLVEGRVVHDGAGEGVVGLGSLGEGDMGRGHRLQPGDAVDDQAGAEPGEEDGQECDQGHEAHQQESGAPVGELAQG